MRRALSYAAAFVVGFWIGAQTSARMVRPAYEAARRVIEEGGELLEELELKVEDREDPLDGWQPDGFTDETLDVLRGVAGEGIRDGWA